MGAGIAQVAARAGYDVVMRDVTAEFLARGMSAIDKSLQRDVDKDRLSPDEKGAILARITTTTELGAFGNAFIVVEAATEDLKIKATFSDRLMRRRSRTRSWRRTLLRFRLRNLAR